MERTNSRFREPVGVIVGPSEFDQPPPPSGAEWLTEFLRREGLIQYPHLAGLDQPGREPAKPPYGWTRETVRAVAIGGGAVLAAGLLAGAVAYHDARRSEPARPLPPPVVAAALPVAAHPLPRAAPPRPAPPPSIGGGNLATFHDFPRQPVHAPLPALSDWAASPILPKTPAQTPAVIAPTPVAPESKPPTVSKGPIVSRAPTVPVTPRRDGLSLRVVHTSSGPTEASRIDALIAGLRGQIGDITGATVVPGPASPDIVVLYFFPADHANARRIAATLGRATRQAYQVKQGHAEPLPAQGTVEIRLP
jgi:hypothetical protein